MTTPTSRTSTGMTLANALYVAMDDFWRAFGRPPKLIHLPWFRRAEIEAMGPWYHMPVSDGVSRFAGVPFVFTCASVIELQ